MMNNVEVADLAAGTRIIVDTLTQAVLDLEAKVSSPEVSALQSLLAPIMGLYVKVDNHVSACIGLDIKAHLAPNVGGGGGPFDDADLVDEENEDDDDDDDNEEEDLEEPDDLGDGNGDANGVDGVKEVAVLAGSVLAPIETLLVRVEALTCGPPEDHPELSPLAALVEPLERLHGAIHHHLDVCHRMGNGEGA